jgi:hypothetical protein
LRLINNLYVCPAGRHVAFFFYQFAQFFKEQAAQKQSERDTLLKKMSPEQRDKFMAEEDAAKQHDAAKSRHVLKTTGMFKAAGSPLTAGGRGGRGGRGVRGSGTQSRPAAPPAATAFDVAEALAETPLLDAPPSPVHLVFDSALDAAPPAPPLPASSLAVPPPPPAYAALPGKESEVRIRRHQPLGARALKLESKGRFPPLARCID